ncbi:hypothetical protein AB3X96_37710 [Paraburkholderia sp. BR13439]|uniref:hypothetical protein n=1 Tax=unclassified Paraburkholderia TaxID=2615204 RepID=UPI0034CD5384
MTTASTSLHGQIEKWFGGAQRTSIRISRGATNQKRSVTVSRIDSPYAIIFFRHGDGSWQVYPQRGGRPAFLAIERAA